MASPSIHFKQFYYSSDQSSIFTNMAWNRWRDSPQQFYSSHGTFRKNHLHIITHFHVHILNNLIQFLRITTDRLNLWWNSSITSYPSFSQFQPPISRERKFLFRHAFIQYKPQTEQISLRIHHILQPFQCHVTSITHTTNFIHMRWATKVTNTESSYLSKQQIVRFDVKMDNVVLMEILECLTINSIFSNHF